MADKPKALYIGVPQVGDALKNIRKQWDFQPSVPDIDTFYKGLVDGTISNDIQILLVFDGFFDPTGQNNTFETLVATMGPHCFLGIINYQVMHKDQMRERIQYEADSLGESENLHFYFIDATKPNQSLDMSVNNFVQESKDKVLVEALLGRGAASYTSQPVADPSKSAALFKKHEDDIPSNYLGQVVAVTSSKGGSGKSTVAVGTATYLAHASINSVREGLEDRPLKVCILDLDVRDGQLGFLTGNSSPTVLKLRSEGISRETVERTVIYDKKLKCDLLLAPKRPRLSEDTPPDFYVELIHVLRKMYDYIVIDTSVNYLDPLLEKVAYPTADQIVFVTDIVVNSVFSMTRWIQEVTTPREKGGMGINRNKIGIVVNKVLSDVNMPGEKIVRSALGIPVIAVIPSNPRLIAHAANFQSMNTILKHKDLYPAIRRLARGITRPKYNLSDSVQE